MIASGRAMARALGIGILSALVATLSAACGQAPAASTGGAGGGKGTSQSVASRAVAYASCMRAHGLPSFPDPTTGTEGGGTSSGGSGQSFSMDFNGEIFNFAGTGIDPSSSTFQAAQQACVAKLGITAKGFGSGPATPQEKQDALAFAACIRAHGFPTFPDPSFGTPPPPQPGGGSPGQPHVVLGGPGFYFQIPSSVDARSQQWQTAMSTCQSKLPNPNKAGP